MTKALTSVRAASIDRAQRTVLMKLVEVTSRQALDVGWERQLSDDENAQACHGSWELNVDVTELDSESFPSGFADASR